MTRQAFANHEAQLHIERREQRGLAVVLVIMGHGGDATLLQRQTWLGPVNNLDLGIFVD